MSAPELKGWITLDDGGSGRWTYARCASSPFTWIFMRIDDMVDSCGGDATYYFHCSVAVVDVQQASECDNLIAALESCDAKSWMSDLPPSKHVLAMAQCLFDYGGYAPMWQDGSPEIDKEANEDWKFDVPDEDSPDFMNLLEAGRKWAEENLLDDSKRELLLDTKIVNKLGQTAREYASGTEGLWNTLRKIKKDPRATIDQKLVLKMYRVSKQTLGAGPVPQDIVDGDEGE